MVTKTLFKELVEELWSSYEDYKMAMSRRRTNSVISRYSYISHGLFHTNQRVTEDGTLFYNDYLGFKVPSHFAPKSLRSGVNMIKELKEEGDWILMVPEDLAKMAEKSGFKVLWSLPMKMEFRGEKIEKFICLSDDFQMLFIFQLLWLMISTFNFSFESILSEFQLEPRRVLNEEYKNVFNSYFYNEFTDTDFGTVYWEDYFDPDFEFKISYFKSIIDEEYDEDFKFEIQDSLEDLIF